MPPTVDRMTLTILEDGLARLEVDGISGANHARADGLVAEFARLMGGGAVDVKRRGKHSHAHVHEHNEQGHKVGQ